ncbi:ABC transporter ATP-binding protein [Desulfomarina sp.]
MEKERYSSSISRRSPDILRVEAIRFLDNGPYSFEIRGGECVGLSGPSGIGKTQLLRAMTDLMEHEGRVLLDDVPAEAVSAPAWRSMVTMIPAESAWWYELVGDHFPEEMGRDAAEVLLAGVGFEPDVFNWQTNRLSTGEKQRLALLRGICNGPGVLLLDEPCSALDSNHTILVEEFILGYQKEHGTAIFWVSHDPEQLRRVASRFFVMEKKNLLESTWL